MSLHYLSDDDNLSLFVNITCDSTLGDELAPIGVDGNTFMYKSAKGCPTFKYDTLTMFLTKYSYLLGVVFIVMGLFLAFFGNKFVNFVIGLVGFLASSTFLLSASFWVLEQTNASPPDYTQWIILGVSLLLGGLIGYLLVKSRKIGVAIMAAWGGATVGFILTTTFVIENTGVYWATIVGCAIVAAFLAFKTEKIVIMLATAHIGSYLAIRGISMYAGGFPNESSLRLELQSGALTWNTFPKTFYAYFAGIIVLSIISFWY